MWWWEFFNSAKSNGKMQKQKLKVTRYMMCEIPYEIGAIKEICEALLLRLYGAECCF